MNLIQSHIDACKNVKVNIPNLQYFTVKLVPYSMVNSRYNLLQDLYLHDVSYSEETIKKGHPISTILVSDRILENAMTKAEIIRKKVYNSKF